MPWPPSTRRSRRDDLAKTEETDRLEPSESGLGGGQQALKVAQATQKRSPRTPASNRPKPVSPRPRPLSNRRWPDLPVLQSAQQQAEAAARQAGTFTLKVAESNVPAVQAQLDDAALQPASARVAPTDGYVVNWQVQEGTMLVPMPLAAAGTFIDTSNRDCRRVSPELAHERQTGG